MQHGKNEKVQELVKTVRCERKVKSVKDLWSCWALSVQWKS